jgi:hypothetical protein
LYGLYEQRTEKEYKDAKAMANGEAKAKNMYQRKLGRVNLKENRN